MKQYAKSFKTNFHRSVKHARIRFYTDPYSALIRANTGGQKNLFSHISRNAYFTCPSTNCLLCE